MQPWGVKSTHAHDEVKAEVKGQALAGREAATCCMIQLYQLEMKQQVNEVQAEVPVRELD